MNLTVAAVSDIVGAMAHAIAASRAEEQVVEASDPAGAQLLALTGAEALQEIRALLARHGVAARKAARALEDLEDDPTDEDYRQKLAIELQKRAAEDAALQTVLERLSTQIRQAVPGGAISGSATVSGGRVYGPVVGVNTGTLSTTHQSGGVNLGSGNQIGSIGSITGGDSVGGDKIAADSISGSGIAIGREAQASTSPGGSTERPQEHGSLPGLLADLRALLRAVPGDQRETAIAAEAYVQELERALTTRPLNEYLVSQPLRDLRETGRDLEAAAPGITALVDAIGSAVQRVS